MKLELLPVADLSADDLSALQTLTAAVYAPEVLAAWPGRAVEWDTAPWRVIGRDAEGAALCHVGVFLREALWNDRAIKIGGIGGVKTHPAVRGRGYATAAIARALDFFRERGDVDFGLLVCEPALVPFYQRLGWHLFPGDLFVTQRDVRVPFTFNLPMTTPLVVRGPLAGRIDLMGPPW